MNGFGISVSFVWREKKGASLEKEQKLASFGGAAWWPAHSFLSHLSLPGSPSAQLAIIGHSPADSRHLYWAFICLACACADWSTEGDDQWGTSIRELMADHPRLTGTDTDRYSHALHCLSQPTDEKDVPSSLAALSFQPFSCAAKRQSRSVSGRASSMIGSSWDHLNLFGKRRERERLKKIFFMKLMLTWTLLPLNDVSKSCLMVKVACNCQMIVVSRFGHF